MQTVKTLTQFIASSNIHGALIRAVVKQLGGWQEFKERASDVTNHGASGGFSGFIYYTDTLAFYAKNRTYIVDLCQSMSDELGEDMLSMIRSFNCLGKDSTSIDEVGRTLFGTKRTHDTQVANALAWFALEEVARSYVDLTYNDEA